MRSRLPFSKLFPALALLIAFTSLMVPATLTYINLRNISQHGRGVIYRNRKHEYLVTVERKQFLAFSILSSAQRDAQAVMALNLPGLTLEMAEDGLTRSWPDTWHPGLITVQQWRALIYPIFGFPFWWLAGIGLDTVLSRRRLRWWWLLLGTLICTCLMLVTAYGAIGTSPGDRHDIAWMLGGFLLWTVLSATFPVAWILQYRRDRHTRSPAPPEIPIQAFATESFGEPPMHASDIRQ
ncbi:MAG TPA: hypothetical protein VGN16_19320 [Acidobacteriaceae bacterium]